MKVVVWASLQSLDVLEQVDRMIPDLVDDEKILKFHQNRISRSHGSRTKGRARGRAALGVALVTLGIAMLVPGPVDIFLLTAGTAVGTAVGIPWLGVAALAVYNVLAIAMIVIGGVLILTS